MGLPAIRAVPQAVFLAARPGRAPAPPDDERRADDTPTKRGSNP
jgi:hypothetical protein